MSQFIALVQMVDDDHSFYVDDVPSAVTRSDKALIAYIETKVTELKQVESIEVFKAEMVRYWSNPDAGSEDDG